LIEGYSKLLTIFGLVLRLNMFVPWNEVVVLDPVLLSRAGSGTTTTSGTRGGHSALVHNNGDYFSSLSERDDSCHDHDFDKMKPLVLATWKHGFKVNLA
jgi:hypothetical protein